MPSLSEKDCIPCKGGVPPVKGPELELLTQELGGNWQVIEAHHLQKLFKFNDFVSALAFTNRVGDLAESQNHHPDIHLSWGKVQVTIWTHKIDGLTESDFVFAAKVDQLG